MLTMERGTIDRFLSADEVDEHFLDEDGDPRAQCGVRVHSSGHAELSGVAIAGKGLELGFTVFSATATLVDCTVSDPFHTCVAIWGGSTVQLFNCRLTGGRPLFVCGLRRQPCHRHIVPSLQRRLWGYGK